MLLRLNQVVFGLGRGVLGASSNRMGVWTQGCSLRKCPGCSSTHTWSPDGGKTVSVESLLRLARSQALAPSGLTVSGGEPTDQAEGITALHWPVLAKRFPALVARLDVAVTGPFVRTLEATPLTGSSNQVVHLLTPLAEQLYYDWQDWSRHAMQVGYAKAEQLVTVGIPHTPRMARAALQVGAIDVTWDRINEEKHA